MTTTVKRPVRQLKPSTLLTKALALFGPRGEFWIKGQLVGHPDEAGLDFGEIKCKTTGKFKRYTDPGDYDNAYRVKHETFCSMGGIKRVNTKRMNEAIVYLGLAIDYSLPDTDYDDCFKSVRVGNAEDTIVSFNDDEETRFVQLRSKFRKAIKLAKKDGN